MIIKCDYFSMTSLSALYKFPTITCEINKKNWSESLVKAGWMFAKQNNEIQLMQSTSRLELLVS